MIPAIELGEVVREIERVELEKSEANSDWNDQLKALKKSMFRLAREMRGDKQKQEGE